MGKGFAAFFCILATVLHAQPCPYAGGEALYLKPCTEDLYFTILGDNPGGGALLPSGDRLDIETDYHLGFAAYAGILFPSCIALEGRYERVQGSDFTFEETEGADVAWLTRSVGNTAQAFILDGFADADFDFDYQSADLALIFPLRESPHFSIFLAAGAHGTEISVTEEIHYQGTANNNQPIDQTNTEHSHLWAVGGKFALQPRLKVCRGITLLADFNAGLLVAEANGDFLGIDTISSQEADIHNENSCLLLSFWGVKAGIELSAKLCGITFALQGGYRTQTYFDTILRNHFYSPGRESTSDISRDSFSLHGFYVGGKLAF